jgi:hypothetical protein
MNSEDCGAQGHPALSYPLGLVKELIACHQRSLSLGYHHVRVIRTPGPGGIGGGGSRDEVGSRTFGRCVGDNAWLNFHL